MRLRTRKRKTSSPDFSSTSSYRIKQKSKQHGGNELTICQEYDAQSGQWDKKMFLPTFKPSMLIGRESQKNVVFQFIKACLSNQIHHKVLYISGVPGMGKTLVTKQVMQELARQVKQSVAIFTFINCLTLHKPGDIYRVLSQALPAQTSHSNDKMSLNNAQAVKLDLRLRKCKAMLVAMVDEVDFLLTRSQEILYNLFEWASVPEYRLCLVVIANTIDLPQKFPPKIVSRMGNNRLVFRPYSPAQIKLVVQQRLHNCPHFEANAIAFVCKKVCTFTSDIRKVLQVLSRGYQRKLQQNRREKITIDQIASDLKQLFGEEETQDLPFVYTHVLEQLRGQPQRSSHQIYQTLKSTNLTPHQFNGLLVEMAEMGLIKLALSSKQSFTTWLITLASRK